MTGRSRGSDLNGSGVPMPEFIPDLSGSDPPEMDNPGGLSSVQGSASQSTDSAVSPTDEAMNTGGAGLSHKPTSDNGETVHDVPNRKTIGMS